MAFLVDSNIILDIVTEDAEWFSWSSSTIEQCLEIGKLWINPIIYAEVSIGFSRIEDLDAVLPEAIFKRAPLPWDAGFLAGKCFLSYRKSSGTKRAPLPDFYIGAHAAVSGLTLITRDARRYKTYFPKVKIICP
ncbi:MAG TPA: type II toxin-antitoxin system VapC family toxin [Myxococcota bacterium]|nr:type II toxin-antitoxin system VapC family toxin [Myxococcota bacterium]